MKPFTFEIKEGKTGVQVGYKDIFSFQGGGAATNGPVYICNL